MLGGYQILDLRKIDLSRGTSEVSITDAEVLKQISNLRDHIQKTYDFSKPLQNQLKPLLIRYRDKKVGEKHEVALYGNIEVINVYYKFRIIACNESEKLTIDVEFEEKTDEYDNKYWDIKTAKILLTTNVDIKGDLTANSIIEKMEGYSYEFMNKPENLTIEEIYAGVVKNGNKLTFVCAFNLTKTGDVASGFGFRFRVPNEVAGKIYPSTIGNYDYVSVGEYDVWRSDNSSVSLQIYSTKDGNAIEFGSNTGPIGDLTLNEKYYCRVEVTLLLSDNLIPQE